MLRRRRPFADVVQRQLELFTVEERELLDECDAALRAYRAAPAGEAEEAYGDYLDVVDAGREVLEGLRDAYASTLDEEADEAYRAEFADAVRRRYPIFALELD